MCVCPVELPDNLEYFKETGYTFRGGISVRMVLSLSEKEGLLYQ